MFIDKSTAVIMPTRGILRAEVLAYMLRLRAPLGFLRPFVLVPGLEVADAYNEGMRLVMDLDPVPTYVLTIEDDMLPEAGAHLALLRSIEETGADAVAGFYRAKNEEGTPLCFGNDFRPFEPPPGECIRVSAVPFGFTLWRTSLFEKMPTLSPPGDAPRWFQTIETETETVTHDLDFCMRMPAGTKLMLDASVNVGHIDLRSGKVY